MQEHGNEDDPSQVPRYQKARSDCDSIEKRVDKQPNEYGGRTVPANFVVMSLFAEMKVRRYSVFEEVNEEISNENKQRGFLARERDALRNHLQDRRRQHEPGSDGHEVFQVAAIPMPLNKNRAAEDVSCGGG